MTDRYTTPFHLRMRSITAQKIKDEEKLKHHIQSQEHKVMQQSSHQQIPNMTSAYKKVRELDYEPTEQEVAYRQLSTSSFVKH
jgi:hypothetical protein|tara:strand:- start:499 stop:747 length:249 start_codon:yes stop_codon:yes gene_type:complete